MAFKIKSSLKVKLISSSALLIFLAFAGISIYNFKASKSQIESRIIDKELPAYINNMGYEISKELVEELTIGEITTRNTAFLHEWLKNRQNNVDEVTQYFQLLKARHKINLTMVAQDSKKYITANGVERVISEKTDPWYFDFIKHEKKTVFNIDRDFASGAIMLFVNNKIVNAEGEVLGCIGVALSVEDIKQFVLSQKFGETSNAMMVDQSGSPPLWGFTKIRP